MGHGRVILAIDPGGGPRMGWSLWHGGLLWDCGNGEPKEPKPDFLVIEKPQVYVQAKQKGDPNDLITLAVQVGQMLERYVRSDPSRSRVYLPAQWKGQVPKDIHHHRIMGALGPEDNISPLFKVPESYRHNVLDAVGLGMFYAKQERLR